MPHDASCGWIRRYVRVYIWLAALRFFPILLLLGIISAKTQKGPPPLYFALIAAVILCATGLGEVLGMAWKSSRALRIRGFVTVCLASLALIVTVAMRCGFPSRESNLSYAVLVFGMFSWSSFSHVSRIFHASHEELAGMEDDPRKLEAPF